MPLLKRRKKKNTKPNTQVYMPYKKPTLKIERRKKKFHIFSKKGQKGSRKHKRFNISFFILYLLFPLLAIALLYISTLFVIRMRDGVDDEEYEEEYVIGLDYVPTFPNSKFIFLSSIDEASVANFVSSGNSAYRLPPNTSVEEAFQYYEGKLPELGWEFVLSVEVGSEEMKNGQYWVRESGGLRIYSKFNDIWYEMITYDQAISGLRERVEREIERDLLLANQELQDLLPDFPWIIKIPKEYIISYKVSGFENLRSVEFKKLGSEERLIISPIGYVGSKTLDDLLRDYIDSLNSDSKPEWVISNTVLTYTEYGRALRGAIARDMERNDVAVIPNPYDKVMYVLDYNVLGEEFFDYVLSNLEPQGLKKE